MEANVIINDDTLSAEAHERHRMKRLQAWHWRYYDPVRRSSARHGSCSARPTPRRSFRMAPRRSRAASRCATCPTRTRNALQPLQAPFSAAAPTGRRAADRRTWRHGRGHAAWHAGLQTISDRPRTRLDWSCEAWRCLPHLKHERVLPVPRNGEPRRGHNVLRSEHRLHRLHHLSPCHRGGMSAAPGRHQPAPHGQGPAFDSFPSGPRERRRRR